ncbi:MAG: DUF192 domain-containing protein [Clostridia bacterium]|nr:DUF192 domain-containing protein [Clostridia bacterium]
MKKATLKKGDAVLIPDLDITAGFFERFRGLMFTRSIPDSYGLLIRPCNQIHMMNMRFPLDVIYLSEDGTVLHIDENIRPWAIGKTVKKAVGVVEINAGACARLGIETGDRLTIEKSIM